MAATHDVIVVGSGHNGMIAAAYLAKAGMSVLVLERHDFFGGASITREVAAPGYRHDVHSMLHIAVQGNPLLANDELKLRSKYGLHYAHPEQLFTTIFDDGTSMSIFQDIDRTCESIGRISPRDAEAYRAFAQKSLTLTPMLTRGMWEPPPPQGAFWAMLDQSPDGRELMWSIQQSLLGLMDANFHHEKVKVHFLKFAAEFQVGPEEQGTGILLLTMPGMIHTFPPGIPIGGAQSLTNALIACLEDLGVELRHSAEVEKILVQGGKATGVRLQSGEVLSAKKAVVGQIHPWLLQDIVEGLDEGVAHRARNTKTASFALTHGWLALSEPPRFLAGDDVSKAMIMSFAPSKWETLRRKYDALRYGEPFTGHCLTAVMNSQYDPSRVPPGGAALNVITVAPYDLHGGGAAQWDKEKPVHSKALLDAFRATTSNVNEDTIVGWEFDTPADMERFSPTFQRGDLSALGKYFFQFGGHRPTPELGGYAVPGISGLYLAGAAMHPPGGITGSGRNTAARMCADFGIDFDKLKK